MISSQLNRIANKGTILSFQTADLTGLANTTSFWVDNSGNPKFRIGTGTVQTIATVANLGSYIPLSGTTALAGDIIPTTTNTNDLGSNTNRLRGGYYQTVYATNKMFVGNITSSAYDFTVNIGLTTLLGGTTTVNGAILPNVGSLNIGGTSSGQHWGNVYASTIGNQVGTFNIQSGGTVRGVVGGTSAPALNLTHTTQEQLRLSFDASNYLSATVNSTGIVTFNTVGTSLGYRFSLGSTEAFRVHSTGNLSIGNTTDAGFRLDVNGTARATQYNIGAISTNFIGGGGFGEIGIMNASMDLRVGGTYGAIWAFVDNSKDIGTSDRRWRTGFFGTSVISTLYRVSALNTAPSSATDTGTLGEIRITATHIYVCTATNTWVRAALTTWKKQIKL